MAPGSYNVQGLGGSQGKLVLHYPVSMFKVMAGSRAKERTESIASQDASPAKHPTRHRKWTEAWTCAQRAGVFLVTKWSVCFKFHCRDTVSVLFSALSSVPGKIPGACVCSVNIYWMNEGNALYLGNLMCLWGRFYSLHFIDEWVGSEELINLPVSYSQ